MGKDVDGYFLTIGKWRDAITELRRMTLACGLTECMKWDIPCYTSSGKNIVLIAALKDCCTLGFPKGSLLADPHGFLAKPGPNTRAARVIRFTSTAAILAAEPALKDLIHAAIKAEESGAKAFSSQEAEPAPPEELDAALSANPALRNAFDKLTPGRRRAYILHFSQPKQSATRASRIEKCLPRILCGKGLNDCTCGLSKRMPACDGSHKFAR